MGVKQVDEAQVQPALPLGPVPYFSAQPRRRTRLRQLLSYLVLVSAALTLSTILPTPWSLFQTYNASKVAVHFTSSDPAAEWKDDVFPLRPPTPWDISTDFSHPRKLEYDVQEGTFLRLDVHPTSGDIVFDMVGDLYCLPGAQALHPSNVAILARPILQGIPYDSNPHFSPTSDRLVFKSDAELGVENIWVVEWQGCDDMDLRATNTNEELREALSNKFHHEELLVRGVKEDAMRKRQRLIREGRVNGIRFYFTTLELITQPLH